MRKILLVASTAALALGATPALAQQTGTFTGGRVGVLVGTGGSKLIDFETQTMGVDAGYDFDTGRVVVGVGAEYQTELGKNFFDTNETALLGRVGVRAGTNALVYGTGGYTRASSGVTPFGDNGDNGYRVGAGVEFGGPMSFKVEQRYSNYGGGADGWQTVAGLNLRF
jgi:outer membrane immunogenic protein